MALREVILTVLTQGQLTGYEITKNFDDVLSYFWRASHQQVYRELARLSKDGCVTHEVVKQAGKPNKKVYGLTDSGRDGFARWVASETDPPRPQYDLLVKLLAAPAVGTDVLLREIERQTTVTSAVLGQLHAKRDACLRIPLERLSEHEQVLHLALRRGLLLVEAQLKWLAETRAFFETGAEALVGRTKKRGAAKSPKKRAAVVRKKTATAGGKKRRAARGTARARSPSRTAAVPPARTGRARSRGAPRGVQPRAAVPQLAPGTVTLAGNSVLTPEGKPFATRFKLGVFTRGQTPIGDFVRANRAAFPNVAPSLLRVIESVSQNEGSLEAVNTYDNAFMTFGCFQWTAGADGARGELAALLDRLNREDAAVFEQLFGRHGLSVHNVVPGPPTNPGVTPSGVIALDGAPLDTPAKKEQLRTLDWAYRFWLAGQNDAMRIVEVRQAMDRVQVFYRSSKHLIGNRQVVEYVTSEAGVALLLDQHVNRPGHVPKTLGLAVAQVPFGSTDPARWTDDDERDLLHAYVAERAKTSMTDSDKRAQTVLDAASRGVVSTRRGSFAA